MQRVGPLSILFLLAAVAGCKAEAPNTSISDKELLDYASQRYDKGRFKEPSFTLGQLNGVEVVVEYICSDVCPAYTIRIIHFTVPVKATCESVGGVEKAVTVPMGIALARRIYCFPRVLTENWEKYIK